MLSEAILRKTKEFTQHKSLQQSAVLFSGRLGIQLIALLSQPVLARLYSPAQFGTFAFLNSLLAILLVVACGRYETAIVLTRRSSHAKGLFQLAQIVLLGYFVLLSAVVLFAPPALLHYLDQKGLPSSYLWLIPLLVLFSGYWNIVHNWLLRFQKFSQISLTLLSQRLLIFAGAVVAAFLPLPGNGLIFGLLIGFAAVFIISLFLQRQTVKISLRSFRSYAVHFRDFPLYSAPTLFLNLFTIHLPVLWLSSFYLAENAGAYSLAYALISVPLSFLDFSIGKIFYLQMAQEQKDTLYAILKKYCGYYMLLLLPLVMITFFWGKAIVLLLLGQHWTETGEMIKVMAPLIFIQGISSLFMYVIIVSRRQSLSFTLQLLQLTLWLIAFSIGLYFQDIYLSLQLAVLFSGIHLVYTVFRVFPLINPSHDSYSNRTLEK